MEFVGGGTIQELRQRVELPEPAIAIILREMLEGIQYLHAQGKIHRDIKGKQRIVLYFFLFDSTPICINSDPFVMVFTFSSSFEGRNKNPQMLLLSIIFFIEIYLYIFVFRLECVCMFPGWILTIWMSFISFSCEYFTYKWFDPFFD